MPDEDTATLIKAEIRKMFSNPAVASRVCDLANTKRPVGTGRHSSYPYYKEMYALKIKALIDQQIQNKQSIIFRYDDALIEGKSERAVYFMVNQSVRYLLENLDTEGTYANWKKLVSISQDKKRGGVCIDLPDEIMGKKGIFNGELVVPRESTTPKWRMEMEDWLESNDDKPFIQENLALSLEEVKELRESLGALSNVIADVSCKKVSIVKTT
jgi:hypothetical protein